MDSKIIAILPEGASTPIKLTKIIRLSDGGFSVAVPYHKAKGGLLLKLLVDYEKHFSTVQRLAVFKVSDRVKLSYHIDGFAQFSGLNKGKIVSGRDKKTGMPKGVGVITQPLNNPIRSGPSFGVGAWGFDEFDKLEELDKNVLLFKPADFYYRHCRPETANAYILEVFVVPKEYWAAVRRLDGELLLSIAFQYFQASMAVIQTKIIDIESKEYLLAGLVSRTQFKFPTKSGYQLNGPGELSKTSVRTVISAYYPPQGKLGIDAITLDWMVRMNSPRMARPLTNDESQLISTHGVIHLRKDIVRLNISRILNKLKSPFSK